MDCNDDLNLTLTAQELQVLSELDSRQFGFLKLKNTEHARTRFLLIKAVKYLEKMLIQSHDEEIKPDGMKEHTIDPKTYCKLGHFHLLLEDYAKAMSAYQMFFKLEKNNWKDPLFLYGLGLCYYHFNAYECGRSNERTLPDAKWSLLAMNVQEPRHPVKCLFTLLLKILSVVNRYTTAGNAFQILKTRFMKVLIACQETVCSKWSSFCNGLILLGRKCGILIKIYENLI